MKTFTKQEIRDLLNKVIMDEVSSTRMVEIMNERVNERVNQSEVSEFKDGGFLHSDWENENLTLICKEQKGDKIYSHAYKCNSLGISFAKTYWSNDLDFRPATEVEKQELVDALAKEGKRWNAEKKCIEYIPVRKFKKGDKVRIKHGVSSKTHDNIGPAFVKEMDDLIGKTMTVDRCNDGNNYVGCERIYWSFLEDWLEPYEGLKDGDLAIFWDFDKTRAVVRLFDNEHSDVSFYIDNTGYWWYNAIKFESKEQYERLIKGEK